MAHYFQERGEKFKNREAMLAEREAGWEAPVYFNV